MRPSSPPAGPSYRRQGDPTRDGVVRRSLDFPDLVSPAAIAETDSTGQAQIVVVCGDGNVYVVGDAADARA